MGNKKTKTMKIFTTVLKEEEGCFQINYHIGKRLEPKGVPSNQSSVTTNPWGEVTLNHISSKYFNSFQAIRVLVGIFY
jgi:hypothetical protein